MSRQTSVHPTSARIATSGTKWYTKGPGSELTYHSTQEEAWDEARKRLLPEGGERVLWGEGGKIRKKDTVSPGNDPRGIQG